MAAKDPYKYFRVEARQLLEDLRIGLAGLAAPAPSPGGVPLLLRLAHTLKGAARVVRVQAISDHAHRFEEIAGPLRERATPASAQELDQLHVLVDTMTAALDALDQPVAEAAPVASRTTTPVISVSPAAPAAPTGPAATPVLFDTVRLQVAEVEAVLAGVAGASAELAALEKSFEAFIPATRGARLLQALVGRTRAGTADSEALARLQSDAGALASDLAEARQVAAGRVERLGRDLTRLHEDTARLRLIPTDALWTFLEQAVRDAAQTLGKRARFTTESRTPRIDTPVFAVLQEALLHLVRNAVAHGLEAEPGRVAAGKSPEGHIRLRLEHRVGRLRVTCDDDGRGIDIESVRRAAVAKGWIGDTGAGSLDLEGATALLLRGGLTTTRTATEISGRGVGLDAVRSVVARLGGSIALESATGRGTTITLEVPVQHSAIEALVVESGGAQLLIPLEAVQRVVRSEPSALRRSGRQEELQVGDRVVPYAALQPLLAPAEPTRGARKNQVVAILLHGPAGLAAIGVDRVLGTTEAVVRPPPALSAAAAFVAGASLGARGAPRLLLEPRALAAAAVGGSARVDDEAPETPGAPLLVIDDSLTTRMLEQSILESAGYAVDLAVCAEDGLRRLRERAYGLVLVDVEMPGMDGFTFVEEVRRDPAFGRLPIIMITSREAPGDRQRGLAAGAQDYVIKGEFDQRRLLRRIGELLS